MNPAISQYITTINTRFQLGNATEHTFRGDLARLIETIIPNITATNEPKRQACGAPDYILTRKNIPVGFIEAKDIADKDLSGAKKNGNKEQFDRYKASLDNIIFTDYLRFHLYRNGEAITQITIGEVRNGKIYALPDNFLIFENLLKDFCSQVSQTIKSPKQLAKMMAGKARLLSDIIGKALNEDDGRDENSSLRQQKLAFQKILIHDITAEGFADVYAQTIAYGMFAARLHDSSLPTFSRQEAAELIPKSNPFLRKLFLYIAGPDIDDRIVWVVDSLVEIFLHCNVQEILKNYGRSTQTETPIIHFYETFLSEYDPKLRKARGVWYTPAPVVSFIVRSVDEVLKTEFGLSQGLADTATTTIEVQAEGTAVSKGINKGKKLTVEKEVHKVQILDPATGTGTFLAEVIKFVQNKFVGQSGMWSNYLENHLLPRLNGFELLMASYAMAHLQLDLLLTETGYQPKKQQRLQVYLTNSLEESHPDTGTLFDLWLSDEANEANRIKRDTPVMCIIGNPPYSGESANKGTWIMSLMDDYKKEPGGKEKLKERNPKWINDDYVKFLRYGQYFIEKNGSGILAFINPHGFLDNPTFRGMRWSLLNTYDKIYTIDLHGNAKKKETTPDGGKDENVFDIMQGVSINIFIKTGLKNKGELARVFHYDLYGKREDKYEFLRQHNIKTIPYIELFNKAPMYFMVQKDLEAEKKYQQGFSINELFIVKNVGIVTSRDSFVIDIHKAKLQKRIKDFFILSSDELKNKYSIKENKTWVIDNQKKNAIIFDDKYIKKINYRPFDIQYIYYNKHFIERERYDVMQHFLNENNVGLVYKKGNAEECSASIMVTNHIIDFRSWSRPGMQGGDYITPLYIYPQFNQGKLANHPVRTPNLDMNIVNRIAKKIGLTFTNEKIDTTDSFSPIDILDYIYAVLHSPTYRETYKEFLKFDFPRIPYPKNRTNFLKLVKLGSELRNIHLLGSTQIEKYITEYPIDGDNVIEKPRYEDGKVYINKTQYFDKVPQSAWEFYIGGYQPAQKWLKDRKGQELSFEELFHYQKIIVALTETKRLMLQIDQIQ